MKRHKNIIFYCFLLLLLFLLTLVSDRALILFDFPSRKINHPSNFKDKRKAPEFTYNFETNSQGLRYREIPLEKPKTQYRMLMLGDSFTEGWGVQANETFSAIMEQMAYKENKNRLFINGGLSSASVQNYRDLLLHVGLKYQPDAVLVNVFANDLDEVISKYDVCLKCSYVRGISYKLWPRIYTALRKVKMRMKPQGIISPGHESILNAARRKGIQEKRIHDWLAFLHEQSLVNFEETLLLPDRTFVKALLSPNYDSDSMDIHGKKHEKNWEKMAQTLTEILEICRKNNIWIGVAYFPSYKQYDKEAIAFWRHAGINIPDHWLSKETETEKRLNNWAKSHKVRFFNLTPLFQNAEKNVPYQFNIPADGHWNALGHRFVAHHLYNWLTQLDI